MEMVYKIYDGLYVNHGDKCFDKFNSGFAYSATSASNSSSPMNE